MGDEASERVATDSEVRAMCLLLQAAPSDGAIGFTSSQLDIHVAHDGRPVPSNLAAPRGVGGIGWRTGRPSRWRHRVHSTNVSDRVLRRCLPPGDAGPYWHEGVSD